MIERDLFGLESERKILKSGVREIFTPHRPIQNLTLFFGREKEVSSLVRYLNTPGQHALLFGNRGVGKSSLANIASDLILKQLSGGQIIKKRCDSNDTFLTIVGELLSHVGIDIYETGTSKTTNTGLGNVLHTSRGRSSENKGSSIKAESPSWVAKQVSHLSAIFVIDEADAIKKSEDKKKIAELIKQLSDEGSKLKILIVGIAETSMDLTAGHPSIDRCLKEVKLSNMDKKGLREILTEGAEALNLTFEDSVIDKIVSISSGYPHFTHLLGLKSAEEAIIEGRNKITYEDFESALGNSIDDAEGTLRNNYQAAIRSSKQEYSNILLAAALCPENEIKALEIRANYKKLFHEEISQATLNNYFQKLVSSDDSSILRRLGKGVYRFNDPRMPSFIKIVQKYIP